jgi:two-component system alkaline phosphatase synthesis response regulator PhoP
MARILIVEDEADLSNLIGSHLRQEGHQVLQAFDGPSGLALVEGHDPHLVILDWMLPGLDGLSVCRRIRERHLVPVIMLTARDEEIDRVLGLEAGADDYVTKPFGASELVARVDALLRRSRIAIGRATPPPTLTFGDVRINRSARTVRRGDRLVSLTPKEYALLLALIDRGGAVATRNELLAEVWGYQSDVSTRTVDIHVSELRKKLEVDAAEPKHILTIRKTGYRFEP